MLNFVYGDTQDKKTFNMLSEQLRDTYDIFSSIPYTIDDKWISNKEELKNNMNKYIHKRKSTKRIFCEL